MNKKIYVGINIQIPISRLIIEGKIPIETRTYKIPPNYIAKEMLLVETPGKTGKFKSRIIAIIKFSSSFKYNSEAEFYEDLKRHCVKPNTIWSWKDDKPKYGWPVTVIKVLSKTIPMKKKNGIKYTKNLTL